MSEIEDAHAGDSVELARLLAQAAGESFAAITILADADVLADDLDLARMTAAIERTLDQVAEDLVDDLLTAGARPRAALLRRRVADFLADYADAIAQLHVAASMADLDGLRRLRLHAQTLTDELARFAAPIPPAPPQLRALDGGRSRRRIWIEPSES